MTMRSGDFPHNKHYIRCLTKFVPPFFSLFTRHFRSVAAGRGSARVLHRQGQVRACLRVVVVPEIGMAFVDPIVNVNDGDAPAGDALLPGSLDVHPQRGLLL